MLRKIVLCPKCGHRTKRYMEITNKKRLLSDNLYPGNKCYDVSTCIKCDQTIKTKCYVY